MCFLRDLPALQNILHNACHFRSCPPLGVPCDVKYLYSKYPNLNILQGALVGGPAYLNLSYIDDRTAPEYTRVALDYNAGFASALAGMHSHTLSLKKFYLQ